MRSILIALSVFACAAASAGDVYKWKDKDGRVHYGDKPKDGSGSQVEMRSEDGTSEVANSDDPARAAECAKRRNQLESYRKAPAIIDTDNLGRTRQFTDDERVQFIALYEKKVQEVCAPPAAPEQQ